MSVVNVYYDAGPGNQVFLRGSDPLSWDQGRPMQPVADSTWRVHVPEGDFEFKPCLNDEIWSVGGDYSVENGRPSHVYPHFDRRNGKVLRDLHEPLLHGEHPITLRVYHPPGYFENKEKRYPVLYALDGQNLFSRSTSTSPSRDEWKLDEMTSALIKDGQIEELLIVGLDARDRFFDYGPWYEDDPKIRSGGGADLYLDFVVEQVKSHIDRHYRTLPDTYNTGLMGSSLGGLFALYGGRIRPDVFTRIAALSPSFWWSYEELHNMVDADARHDDQKIYIDAGTLEGNTAHQVWRVAEALREDGWVDGYDLQTELFENADHSELAWSQRLDHPLRFLYPWNG